MTWFKWSRTASNNAGFDPTVNWAEGMAPSAVNDSARAMMAAAAKYRDDIAGAITTGGTSSAYTVSSYQGFDSLANMHGAMIAFVPHATNSANATLNVDGLGARNIRGLYNTNLTDGVMLQYSVYRAVYNNSDSIWYLQDYYGQPWSVPIGAIVPYAGFTSPNGSFALPYGQAISRSVYSALYSTVGNTYGAGDGFSTFNLPDIRGCVIASLDNMGGSAAGRLTSIGGGTSMGARGGEQTHLLTTAEIPSHSHANTLTDPGHRHDFSLPTYNNASAGSFVADATSPQHNTYSSSTVVQTNTTGITITNANAGGDGAHNIVQPTMLMNSLIRII